MKEIYKTKLTKDQIKAIRVVLGLNSDLRVKCNVKPKFIWDFIDKYRYGLLGSEFGLATTQDPTSDEWDDYEKCINRMVRQVLDGR